MTSAAYRKLQDIFKSDILMCLKMVFDQCVLLVPTYEMYLKVINKIKVTQRAIVRSILNLSLRDTVPSHIVRNKTMFRLEGLQHCNGTRLGMLPESEIEGHTNSRMKTNEEYRNRGQLTSRGSRPKEMKWFAECLNPTVDSKR